MNAFGIAVRGAAIVLLLCSSYAAYRVTFLVDQLTASVATTEAQVNELLSEVPAAAASVDARIDSIQQNTREELDATRELVETQLEGTRDLVDGQLGSITELVDRRTGEIVAEVRRLNAAVEPVSANLAVTLRHVSLVADRAATMEAYFTDQFLDCRSPNNPGCAYSRFLAITGELMRTMDSGRRTALAIEEATPRFVQRFDDLVQSGNMLVQTANAVGEDVHTVSDRYANPTVKDSLKGALFDGLKVCAILCFK